MRCFLAIELGEETKKELIKIQKHLPEAKMKLVEEENLHLTLKFFGEIEDFQANKIKEILKQIKFGKFKANLGNIGIFPSSNFIRVVWVSLEPSEKIKELHKIIDEMLGNEKMREDKAFESHITLARIKFVKDKKIFIDEFKKIDIKQIEFEINSFILKESILTEKGPIYKDIEKFDLI